MAAALLPSCNRGDISGPPELRLGRDECGECGMLINEDRCSSAILVERPGGALTRREYIMFDDIGCMLDYEHDRGGEYTLVDGFVRDHGTRQWVRAGDAFFLFADRERLLTPMGTGMIAFATQAAAAEKQQEVQGEIMSYQQLGTARRQWMWGQYGTPEEPDEGR
jgi:hypothetical protein